MPGSEPRSFEEYVAARYAVLVRSAFLLTGHHHDAEDLVQAALVKAVAVWSRIEDAPEPYVRRIMVNDNISRWRRHRGRERVGVPPGETWTDGRDGVEDRLDLAEALSRLTAKQRTVLVLRYYEDLTERQTAELMGVALGTVKSQTRDALAALRRVAPALAPGAAALRR
ncbi:SigE family RNA polymerase sigma factor [Nocardioides mesophilus]|uniref:SigE family RNA polymerase sigma factor n=1 Tax=Nocardioides mesophilus TaxID=433659 RepID=A0A7G9RBH9_9ACTN|nr:SigE family RNA polymerase sigma factor [Nocardioides mesophilus]QNN52954.1 SigE family RNA polymerase sigma factor [Nocardioides mesophilus]